MLSISRSLFSQARIGDDGLAGIPGLPPAIGNAFVDQWHFRRRRGPPVPLPRLKDFYLFGNASITDKSVPHFRG
jgi:hypothetical protein